MDNCQTEQRYGTVNFERRKHPRFSINLPIEYWPESASKSNPAHTGDISEGGLLLYLPAEVGTGQNLRIRLFIDSGLDFLSIEAFVRVVWKDMNLGDKQRCRTGAKFIEISAQDYGNLTNFLKGLIEMKGGPSKFNAVSGLPSSSGTDVNE